MKIKRTIMATLKDSWEEILQFQHVGTMHDDHLNFAFIDLPYAHVNHYLCGLVHSQSWVFDTSTL